MAGIVATNLAFQQEDQPTGDPPTQHDEPVLGVVRC